MIIIIEYYNLFHYNRDHNMAMMVIGNINGYNGIIEYCIMAIMEYIIEYSHDT